MENFKNTINSLFDLFDRLSKADTSPTANYNMAEMFMSRALKGNEKAKTTLASFISKKLNINYQIVEIALDEWINNKTVKESKTMNKKLIKLTEGDLHRIVKKATNKILRETLEPAYPGSNSTDISDIAGRLYDRINDCFLRDRGEGDWDFEIEQAVQENPKEIYHLMADLQEFLNTIYNMHINN